MKNLTITVFALLSSLALATIAQAHEPEEHMKDAEQPNCAAMKEMDHAKMDMNDPVMQAMMKQCMESMHTDEEAPEASHDDHDERMKHDAPPKGDDEKSAASEKSLHESPGASEEKPGAEHNH